MKLNNKSIMIVVPICLVSIFAFWYLAHNFMLQKTLQIDLERKKLSQISDNIQMYNSKYGNLDDYIDNLGERYQAVSVLLPDQMQQGQFIDLLQQIALNNQVKIISIKPSAMQQLNEDAQELSENDKSVVVDESKVALNELPIIVKIESGYVQVINFLKAIEDSDRAVKVDNLSMTGKDDGDKLICDLNIKIFSSGEQQKTPPQSK